MTKVQLPTYYLLKNTLSQRCKSLKQKQFGYTALIKKGDSSNRTKNS